jgi:hypothetical protein
MTKTRAMSWPRMMRQWPLLLATLGLVAVLPSIAHGQREDWTKLDCATAEAHLLPPPGIRAECFRGPFKQSQGQVYACRFSSYAFGFPADASEPHFYARAYYPKKEGKNCSAILLDTPTNIMQHVNKFVDAEATNWSAIQSIGQDIQVMFFDAKNQKRDGKCFSFVKLGPTAGRAAMGHQFTMMGFFCKAPGQPLDANMAATLINGIRINLED